MTLLSKLASVSFPDSNSIDAIEAAGDYIASQCGLCGRRHWGECEVDSEAAASLADDMHIQHPDHPDTTASNPLCGVCIRRAGVWLRFLGLGGQCVVPDAPAQATQLEMTQ